MFRLINFQTGRLRVPQPSLPKPSLPQTGSLRLSNLALSRRGSERAAGTAGRSILSFLRRHHQSLLFVLWLFLGSVFYTLTPGRDDFGSDLPRTVTDGFYEAVTVGYSVGLSPRDPNYMPNPWFSSAYILCGASLIAVILTNLGQTVEDGSSKRLFDDLKRREEYERNWREGGLCAHIKAFCAYNLGYVVTIALWLGFLAFIIVWSIIATSHNDPLPGHQWGFAYAQYFAISLCSSAGSFSLPYESPLWAYGLAAVSMAIGVPLMALAISSIVMMCLQESKYDKVKRAAWTPVNKTELETLRHVGFGQGEEVISKGDFVLLGMLRMGTEAGLIAYLCDAYDSVEDERGSVAIQMGGEAPSDGSFSAQARAYVGDDDGSHAMRLGPIRSGGASFGKGDGVGRRPRLSSKELSSTMLSFSSGLGSSGLGLSSSVLSAPSMERGRAPKLGRDQWSMRASMDEKSEMDLSSLMKDKAEADMNLVEEGGIEPPIPEEEPGNDSEDSFRSDG